MIIFEEGYMKFYDNGEEIFSYLFVDEEEARELSFRILTGPGAVKPDEGATHYINPFPEEAYIDYAAWCIQKHLEVMEDKNLRAEIDQDAQRLYNVACKTLEGNRYPTWDENIEEVRETYRAVAREARKIHEERQADVS